MSAAMCGEPLSLSRIPRDRVVRLRGLTDEQLTVGLDPLPDGAPVVIRYRLPTALNTSQRVIDDVLTRLEGVALELFPAWLPDGELIDSGSDLDRRVVRDMAHRQAAATTHFGPFLAELAEAAVRGSAPVRMFEPDVRAGGLNRIIADTYGRETVALLVSAGDAGSEDGQRRIAAALEWLVDRGGIAVWLAAGALPQVDRYSTWQVSVPGFVTALTALRADPSEDPPPVTYPALAGVPHPASAAEQALERRLVRCSWAQGRSWNQEYASHTLTPPIRVDLMWSAERCVVEIDGPDHRGSLKYAADRRRDNGLTLDGFAVLRFTNEEIDDDPARVLAAIESLLEKKRTEEGNPA